MVEVDPDSRHPSQTLRFASGQPGFGVAVIAAFIAIYAITIAGGKSDTSATPGHAAGPFIALEFFASILFLIITRQWAAEFDLVARRL